MVLLREYNARSYNNKVISRSFIYIFSTLTVPGIGRIITVNSPELLEHVFKNK